MKKSKIVSDAIVKRTNIQVERFVNDLIGDNFVLRRSTYFLPDPLSYNDITAIVGGHYATRTPESDCGYFVEFPFSAESDHEITLTFFEVCAQELTTYSPKDEHTLNRTSAELLVDKDELFVELIPIFPIDYYETEFVLKNGLTPFYVKPFRLLD
jgi:hypothetical protein